MTKILYWNIDKFQTDTINRTADAGGETVAMSADRRAYIIAHINEADPDIFIIVEPEVTNWNGGLGVLSVGNGWIGIIFMLNLLRINNPGPDADSPLWALVPPLVTGRPDTVAVFFRTDRVQFTGPNIWTGGMGPIGPGIPANYPIGRKTLPEEGTVNPNSAFNPGANIAQCAANVRYQTVADPLVDIDFGAEIRRPYQTTFWDIANNRNINIFTVHSPANNVQATTFLNNLVTATAITQAPVANEVRLVLGDFNFNLLGNLAFYGPMTNLGYVVALCPQNAAPVPPLGFNGFFSTTIKTNNNGVECSSQNGNGALASRYYPGYAYVTGQSLDNVLYWTTPPLALAPTITIVNKLVGSPFTAVTAAATPATAQAAQVFPTVINWAWNGQNLDDPLPPQNIAPKQAVYPGFDAGFRQWNQYGKVRSTSDHLPLFFTF